MTPTAIKRLPAFCTGAAPVKGMMLVVGRGEPVPTGKPDEAEVGGQDEIVTVTVAGVPDAGGATGVSGAGVGTIVTEIEDSAPDDTAVGSSGGTMVVDTRLLLRTVMGLVVLLRFELAIASITGTNKSFGRGKCLTVGI